MPSNRAGVLDLPHLRELLADLDRGAVGNGDIRDELAGVSGNEGIGRRRWCDGRFGCATRS
jgi:hypothetical protein